MTCMQRKEKYGSRILSVYSDSITGLTDLFGDAEPSLLFHLFGIKWAYLLSGDQKQTISSRTLYLRRKLNPLLRRLGKLFLEHKQVFESKNNLIGTSTPDAPLILPKHPVIWVANHSFKDDILATVLASRHSYIFFGSLPMFYNTFDGISAYLNGVVMCNRKISASRQASAENAKRILQMGTDLLLFPEGVWNKTPEKLLLDFWPGVFRIAKETGSQVIPVIHYLADPHKKEKGNVIHTVIADPISMDVFTEKEGLSVLRDTMATWYYLMMERYGRTTRQQLLSKSSYADEAWEKYIAMHVGKVRYYDREIELKADYRPREIIRPIDVWRPIAELDDLSPSKADHVHYARQLVNMEELRDVQHRY